MDFELPPRKQRHSIKHSNARLNIWHGSVRSGKTWAKVIRAAREICEGPPGPVLFIGKTERTLYRNVLKLFQDLFGKDSVKYKRGVGEAVVLGRQCDIVGANDERSEGKIRGSTYVTAIGDELTLWPEGFFKMCLSRLSLPGAKFFGTTNPDAPTHWLRRDYLKRAAELKLRAFHFRLEDNKHLDPEYVKAVKREYTGLWYRRFILGEWCLAEGAIWDMFRIDDVDDGKTLQRAHVIKELPNATKFRYKCVAIDYGTAAPFVALLLGISSKGDIFALDELRWDSKRQLSQKTDAQYSKLLRDWMDDHDLPGNTTVVVDPSAASLILQLTSDGVAAQGANNDVAKGLSEVATQFGNNTLFILDKCVGTIDEIPGYVWDPKKQERGEDAPIKESDHGPDALRYGIRHLKPYIEQFQSPPTPYRPRGTGQSAMKVKY